MVDEVTRTNIDTAFLQWYSEMLKLAEGEEKTVPRKAREPLQRSSENPHAGSL